MVGCSQFREIKQDDPFRLIYSEDNSLPKRKKFTDLDVRRISFSANRMPLGQLFRLISDHFLIGIVYSEKLEGKVVNAEFKETDLNTVFTVLSRQLGVDLVKIGNTFYLGEIKSEDKAILIRRVLSQDESSLKNILDSVKSPEGRCTIAPGRLVVVSDTDFVIRRISEVLDDLDSYSVPSWIVQLYFLVLRKDALAEGGLTMTTSGSLSYNISENTINLENFKIEGLFSGLIESSYADLYASPMFILRDGIKGTWSDGQRVPVPKRTVSDYGTVTTSGFDYIDTGLKVVTSCTQSKVGAYLQLDISLSDIQSYVEGNPVTSQTQSNICVDLVPNRIYLLAELQRYSMLDKQQHISLFSRDKGKSVIQVWGRVYRTGQHIDKKITPSKLPD